MTHTNTHRPSGPTTDFRFAVQRFTSLLEASFHQPVSARKGRNLAWQAVYGDLWHVDLIGQVPAEQQSALHALVKKLNTAVFPGGAVAQSVTADQARTLLENCNTTGH